MQVFTFNPHLIHLFVTTFLTLFLKAFNLQVKAASKSAGNWNPIYDGPIYVNFSTLDVDSVLLSSSAKGHF
jgi:hypothetical protein